MRLRAIVALLFLLAAAHNADAVPCRYNCSNVNNIYCKTKDLVCAYPDGDELAMERANMLLAKSTKKKCTRAMKLFICHLYARDNTLPSLYFCNIWSGGSQRARSRARS